MSEGGHREPKQLFWALYTAGILDEPMLFLKMCSASVSLYTGFSPASGVTEKALLEPFRHPPKLLHCKQKADQRKKVSPIKRP